MKRSIFGTWLLVIGAAAAAADPPRAAPPPAPAATARAPTHDAALQRLEVVVRSQVVKRKGRSALRFEEAVLAPQVNRLVWGLATIRASRGRTWRVAIDERTRWYYVLQSGADKPERWFGPLDEVRSGVFEQVGGKPPG